MPERATLRAGAAVGLVAACALALQVLLTRVLSAVLAYHFSFLAISLALLGVGAGALAVYLRPGWAQDGMEARLARWSALLAVLLIVEPAALVRLDYSSGIGSDITPSFALILALVCAPLGLALGTAMPTGLTRLAGLHPGAVPWAWAVNGVASVLASVAAVAIAITWGFSAVMLAATACYLVALADVRRGAWPRSQAIAGASGSLASAASMSASENSGSSSVPARNAS